MNCHQCGTELLNNEVICSNCGVTTDLEKIATIVEQPPPLEAVIEESQEEIQAEEPVKNNKFKNLKRTKFFKTRLGKKFTSSRRQD